MYVIIAPIQVKEGSKEQVLEALVPNARAAATTEPGCLRFDVIQDAGDPNLLWVYEIYVGRGRLQLSHPDRPLQEGHRDHRPQPRRRRPRGRGPGQQPTSGPPDAEWK